jgi:two-component system KDP operon response regulator KdpE
MIQMDRTLAHYSDIALGNLGEGLFLVDGEGQVVYCNAQLSLMLSVKDETVVGSAYAALFREIAELSRDAQKTRRELELALRSIDQRPVMYPLMRHLPNGRFQVRFFPLTIEQGFENGWGGTIRDVTAEWKEITEQAEHLLAITRELWTPLAAIKGSASMLMGDHQFWDESQRQHQAESIYKGVEQLTSYLEYAQMLLKLELDATKLTLRQTAVPTIIHQVLNGMSARIAAYRCSIALADDLPLIELDASRVEQVLFNLIDHAAKHSPRDGEIQIEASVESDELLVSVSNQGVGISEEHLPYLFDAFYRVGPGESDYFANAGLALHMTRKLVLLHGGRIWAESALGHGTRITFALPLHAEWSEVVIAPKTAPAPKSNRRARTKPGRNALKALVVEDDFRIAELLQLILEGDGYQATWVSKGKLAIDQVANYKPDVVLLDVFLPDINGLEILSQIREFSAVPVVMVTANSKTEDTAQALDLGADDYIIKPFNRIELLARIRATVRRAVPTPVNGESQFRAKDLSIDFGRRQVSVRGESVKLSKIEYNLLSYLAANPGHVLSHSQILSKIWGPEYKEDTQYLWVTMSRLRKKLEEDPANPEYILTEPGVGYYLPPANEDSTARLDSVRIDN